MMSNNNMLGGPREASQTTPQPNTTLVNQLIQIELEGLTLRNVALGLAIYVAISIVLFIVGTQSVATLHQWLWLSAVSCTGLSIWLWLANAKRAGNLSPSSTQIAIYSSAVICAALWGGCITAFYSSGSTRSNCLSDDHPDHPKLSVVTTLPLPPFFSASGSQPNLCTSAGNAIH